MLACIYFYLYSSLCWCSTCHSEVVNCQTKMADAAIETAPTDENDDSWLYGDSNNEQGSEDPSRTEEKQQQQTSTTIGEPVRLNWLFYHNL